MSRYINGFVVGIVDFDESQRPKKINNFSEEIDKNLLCSKKK